MNDLEAQRLANVREKERLLAALNIDLKPVPSKSKPTKKADGQSVKKRKITVPQTATRSSARIRDNVEAPDYKDQPRPKVKSKIKGRRGNASKVKIPATIIEEVEVKSIIPFDIKELQKGWTDWRAEAPSPTRAEDGTFHFNDFPTFQPNKSPEEMIREGAFGGSYWRPLKSKRLVITIKDDWTELPPKWISGLPVSEYLTNSTYNPDINKYKVTCGQTIEEWEAAGWIAHEFDIRGWFQWYTRFFQGRRCEDDARQVSRWAKCVGPSGRWKRMLLKKYLRAGVRDVFDDGEDEQESSVSPVMHQTVHHWAYEIKQIDLDEAWSRA